MRLSIFSLLPALGLSIGGVPNSFLKNPIEHTYCYSLLFILAYWVKCHLILMPGRRYDVQTFCFPSASPLPPSIPLTSTPPLKEVAQPKNTQKRCFAYFPCAIFVKLAIGRCRLFTPFRGFQTPKPAGWDKAKKEKKKKLKK